MQHVHVPAIHIYTTLAFASKLVFQKWKNTSCNVYKKPSCSNIIVSKNFNLVDQGWYNSEASDRRTISNLSIIQHHQPKRSESMMKGHQIFRSLFVGGFILSETPLSKQASSPMFALKPHDDTPGLQYPYIQCSLFRQPQADFRSPHTFPDPRHKERCNTSLVSGNRATTWNYNSINEL